MTSLVRHSLDALYTGSVANLITTIAIAGMGKVECDNAMAPLNAISHMAWGDKAFDQNGLSWKYTATGMALNMAAVTSWAIVHESIAGEAADQGNLESVIA